MIKRFIIAIILLVIIVGGIVGFNLFREKAIADFFANMPKPETTVSTIKAAPVTWEPGIETIGTVGASRGVDLTVETTGIVKDINFKSNDKVEDNAVLVQLDDAVERADLDSAKTQNKLDQQSLDRAIELQSKGVGSTVTTDTARAAFETSTSTINRLQAVLDQKQLTAPYAGTIGIPKIELGQFIQPGTVVATLQDLETMRADFSVPEQQLVNVKLGQAVMFGATEDDMSFQGSITGIEPKVDPSSRLVAIRAEITNPDNKLSPGQFVQVRVKLPNEDSILAVPDTAVVTSLYGDYVYVVRPAKAGEQKPEADADNAAATTTPPAEQAPPAKTAPPEAAGQQASGDAAPAKADGDTGPKLVAAQVFVKVGRRANNLIEIKEGLKEGDEIVTAGQNRLSNNGPVKVDNTVTPQGENETSVEEQ